MASDTLLCLRCQHLREGLTCAAFPDHIPVPILDGRVDHRQPYPGDHGIQFAPIDPDADQPPSPPPHPSSA